MQFLISLFAFLFAIAILVVFHEWGHFWVARRFGVKVLRFSVGFGKPLWRHQAKSGVEYVVAAIPLGGYVKMLDERNEEEPVPEALKPYAFNRKPLWVRFLVVLAGPAFNFIFAILAYWLMFMIGVNSMVARVGDVTPDSIAYHAGVQTGDHILTVDDQAATSWQAVHRALLGRLGDTESLKVQVKTSVGKDATYWLPLKDWELKGDRPNPIFALGIEPYRPPIPAVVEKVVPESAAEIAGIVPGDTVISLNHQPITRWKDFTRIVTANPDQPLALMVLREGQTHELTLTPRLKVSDQGERVGFAGIAVKAPPLPDDLITREHLGPWDALVGGVHKTADTIGMTFQLLGKMIVGKLGLKHLSGPIAIAEGAGATAVVGVAYYLGFLALISISLGVINLLPIPVLDGGHLLFYVVEAIIGRPVSEKVQLMGFKIGFMLLISLMVIAFYNDVVRFF